MSAPIEADAEAGQVWIRATPEVAKEIGEAWAFAHTLGVLDEQARPRWHDDVVQLATAAANAQAQAGNGPAVAQVRLLRVAGGEVG